LVACYAVFGNQETMSKNNFSAINAILNNSGIDNPIEFTKIEKVLVEQQFPEIIEYRKFFKVEMERNNFHLYPDIRKKINQKLKTDNASFEGSTHLDLLIEGISNGNKTTCFVEAKFLSDIDNKITYNPMRDQIIRNIDAGIDYVQSKKYVENFEDFYFCLLTPEIFKPKTIKYEYIKQRLGVENSRFFCCKMEEYQKWENIKRALPHRKDILDKEWEIIANNVKWITFEDFYKNQTINDENEQKMIKTFFEERNLS
jgi:hypothetical protein